MTLDNQKPLRSVQYHCRVWHLAAGTPAKQHVTPAKQHVTPAKHAGTPTKQYCLALNWDYFRFFKA